MKLAASTVDEAVKDLRQIRRYAPYKYGGTWLVCKLGDQCYAYRNRASIRNKMTKLGIKEVDILVLS